MTTVYKWEDRVEIFPYLEKVTNVTTTAITANGNKVSIPNKILNGKLLLKLSVLNKENTEIVTLIHTTIINGKEHLLHKGSAYYLSTKKSQSANSGGGGGNSSVTDIYKIAKENGFKGNELEFVNAILTDKDTDSWDKLQDIPDNIGYIDSENQSNNGNVYTKEQIEEKLRTKVDFPVNPSSLDILGLERRRFLVGYEEELSTVPGQNEPNYYVVRYNLASVGLNLGNSNLKITKGQIRDLDVTGAKLRIKGLEDKSADASFNNMKVQNELGEEAVSSGKPVIENLMQILPSNKLSNNSYDPAYSEYLVFNPNTGKVAKSDKPQIITNFTVPNSITINHNTNVDNVNWQPNPSYPRDLTDTLDFVKSIDSIGFTPVLANEFVVRKLPNSKFPSSVSNFNIPDFEFREGEMLYNGNVVNVPAGFRDLDYQANNEEKNALINIFINKELPVDKDWVLRFRLFGSDLLGGENSFFGFRERVNVEPNHDLINDVVFRRSGIGGFRSSFAYRNNSTLIAKDYLDFKNNDFHMIKKGNIVTLFTRSYHDGVLQMGAMGYINTMKYIVFGLNLNARIFSKFYMKDIGYWIAP